mmetsp:Transcript_40286/g.62888  ORF Transcript_40286/g.62888 Transcript_40286/m.62888 type:complete len:113 (+) Transcript_40286:428-766(+)
MLALPLVFTFGVRDQGRVIKVFGFGAQGQTSGIKMSLWPNVSASRSRFRDKCSECVGNFECVVEGKKSRFSQLPGLEFRVVGLTISPVSIHHNVSALLPDTVSLLAPEEQGL